jgi:hypothetical protein
MRATSAWVDETLAAIERDGLPRAYPPASGR